MKSLLFLLWSLWLCNSTYARNFYIGDIVFCLRNPRNCPSTHFNCRCEDAYTGQPPECIERSWLCDGWYDCSNGADEIDCICPSDQFQCGCNHTGCANLAEIYHCIPRSQVCDNDYSQCPSRNDEKNCPEFLCPNGTAIPVYKVCDGINDCGDATDEVNCTCPPERPHRCNCNQPKSMTCTEQYTCYGEEELCNGVNDCGDWETETSPLCSNCTLARPHRCGCNMPGDNTCNSTGGQPACYSDYDRCDSISTCWNGTDETLAACEYCPPSTPYRCGCNRPNNYTCPLNSIACYSEISRCDGTLDCPDGSDEGPEGCANCTTANPFRCGCNQPGNYTCTLQQRACYSTYEKCDGNMDCSDGMDESEAVCSICPIEYNNRCPCNQPGNFTCTGPACFSDTDRCSYYPINCADKSDEMNCWTQCPADKFTCSCLRSNPTNCSLNEGCIAQNSLSGPNYNCPPGDSRDGTFVIDSNSVKCGPCNVVVQRLASESACDAIGLPFCDVTTCISALPLNCTAPNCPSTGEVICTSNCTGNNLPGMCTQGFQCDDGTLISNAQFCNGVIDCADGSDEIHGRPGFKCVGVKTTCVLPQRYVHDDVAQCMDGSDVCQNGTGCFRCLDNRFTVSNKQLCDGVFDCYDLSDECLCQKRFDIPVCQELFALNDPSALQCGHRNFTCSNGTGSQSNANACLVGTNSAVRCATKYGEITATRCDLRPECQDFRDECSNCPDPPLFCKDSFCHSYYPLGDRYCDGIYDESWTLINDSRCLRGFDERDCPKRFACASGIFVNIDISQRCNGIVNCDDGSDELNCPMVQQRFFSSQTQMISSLPLLIIIWVMAVLTVCGNLCVIVVTILKLREKHVKGMAELNHFLILNLSLADLMMGIYLLIVAIQSAIYSGYYGQVDYSWRTSLTCSAIGTLAIVASETSCFIMTILSGFRLYNVYRPFRARSANTCSWKMLIALAWLASLLLGILPNLIPKQFVTEVYFSNNFTSTPGWSKENVSSFACRLSSLSGKPIEKTGDIWDSTTAFLSNNFPQYSVLGEVGYYSETSVCLPRLYVRLGDRAWGYTFGLITINFIFFVFVAFSYILIYRKSSNRPITSDAAEEQHRSMQKRIARLILTDFLCWIPICIMAYISLAGVPLAPVVYVVSAGVLLPINSSLNPILYTKTIDNILNKVPCQKTTQHKTESSTMMTSVTPSSKH